ncbi:MAG: HAD-superfamily hydrolase, subfamily variant 1, partial [Gammaproteobacteria bacterium]|nr:HAD-superfamily hydrolase, subfamily variant 1 [Gammaproteobacteria bacterium]
HFDAFNGLQLMFSQFGITFTQQDYQEYQLINQALWVDYQQGIIIAQQLQHQRFHTWANKLQIPAQALNSAFLAVMAEICMPLAGAINLLDALRGKAKLGIITNGFTELQQARLKRTGLSNHFDLIVISEQVGVAKPHRDIFEHALSLMGNPGREKVLMVGDNPDTDILGGLNVGLDTCWLNVDNKSVPEGISPHYQVSSLTELQNLLLAGQDSFAS